MANLSYSYSTGQGKTNNDSVLMGSLFVFHRTLQKPAKRARETREQSSPHLLGRLVYLLESCLQGHEHL